MSTTPVFEVRLEPKSKESSIVAVYVRVDDPVNIKDSDTLLNFIERQFPMYHIAHVIQGYKQVIDSSSKASDPSDPLP